MTPPKISKAIQDVPHLEEGSLMFMPKRRTRARKHNLQAGFDPYQTRLLQVEALEDRRLLAGLTIVTHGFQFGNSGTVPIWLNEMSHSIATEIADHSSVAGADSSDVAQYTMDLFLNASHIPTVSNWRFSGDFTPPLPGSPFNPVNLAASLDGEAVVVLNWSAIANLDEFASTGSVARAAYNFLNDELNALGDQLLSMPIHLIGHSRGASLMAALAEDFAHAGIVVDQVTYLDTHPVFPLDHGNFGPVVTDNVVFADSYWREGGLTLPNGESVDGAYDRMLVESLLQQGGYDNLFGGEHSDVHLWYHGTIGTNETGFPGTDGEEDIPSNWYGDSHPSRDGSGYYFSRVIGGTRDPAGLHPLLGGSVSTYREIVGLTEPAWPNVMEIALDGSDSTAIAGTTLQFSYFFRDQAQDGEATIDFLLDRDRNPFNGNEGIAVLPEQTLPSTGNSFALYGFSWDTSGIQAGTYYVYGRVSDGQRVRYAYLPDAISIVDDDHGDDAGSASPIGTNQSIPGSIAFAGDVDWLRFSAVQGNQYVVNTQLVGLSDMEVILFDRDGNTVLDSAIGSAGTSPSITWVAPATGEYYVAIRGAGNATGGYGLDIVEGAVGDPDLVVSSLTVPAVGQIGSTIGVPTVVHNSTSAASQPTIVRYVLENGTNSYDFGELAVPALGGHQDFVATPSFPIPAAVLPDIYTIRAVVDPDMLIDETNNDNNSRVGNTSIIISTSSQPLPDLVANSLTLPATGNIGAVIHVGISIRNVSGVPVGPSIASIVIPGSPDVSLGSLQVPPLTPGQSYDDANVILNIPGFVQPGSYSLELRLNPSGAINEASTANNVVVSSSPILLQASASGDPDFAPRTVTPVGSTAMLGGTIAVNVVVDNPSATAAGPYPITFLFSTDQRINFADREAITVTRSGGIAAGGTDSWQQTIPVPGNLAPGSYYIGVDADRGAALDESNNFNNIAISALPITVVAPVAQANLVSLGYNVQPDVALWGQSISVANNLRNQGTGVFNGTAQFLISPSPAFAGGNTVQLGSRPISSLAPGATSGANTPLALPGARPADFSGNTVFVGMRIDGVIVDFEAITVNDPPPQLPLDVLGEDFDVTPFALVNWGGRLEFDIRYKNRGTQYAANFHNAIYISQDSVFDGGDYLLLEYDVPGVAPGGILGESRSINLPPNPPAGFSGTDDVFLLHVSDNRNELDEGLGELNNSGLGNAIDSREITITDNPPAGGGPIIGDFFVLPQAFVRGVDVDVIADNVVDDSGVVNDVIVYADNNGNGLFDSADPELQPFYMSKLGNTFTGELDTSILDTGDVTLIAVAVDNQGNRSQPKFFTVTVSGVGTAVPDEYEYNDTQDSAPFLGINAATISNLSITAGDHDWFQFSIPDSTIFTVRIDFFQEDGPDSPGNLALEVRRVNGDPVGFSDSSVSGQTFEQVVSGNTSGLFEVHVRGQSPSTTNDDYSLTISVAPPAAGAPTIGSFTLSPSGVVRPDGQLTLALNDIHTTGGATINNRAFYADFNRNHVIDSAEFLGFGNLVENGGVWQADITTSVSSWGIGEFDVLGRVWDSAGRASVLAFNTVVVANNRLPTIASLAAPSEVDLGETFELVATSVIDPDSASVPSVVFRIDTDGDGEPSPPDVILPGTPIVDGTTVSLSVDTSLFEQGTYQFIATPFDGEEYGASVGVATEIVAAAIPHVSVGAVSYLNLIREGQPLVLEINGTVSAAEGATATVYTDSNGTGALEGGIDDIVATGVEISSGNFAATIPPDNLPEGVHLFFVEVAAPGAESYFASLVVSVEPNLAPSLSPIADRVVFEGNTLVVNLSAFDPNGDPLTWRLDSPLNGAVLDAETRQLTWTPTEEDGPAIHNVVITVLDNGAPALQDTETFAIDVREANSLPSATPVEPLAVFPGDTVELGIAAADSDVPVQALTFSLAPGSPPDASIDPLSGLLSWHVPADIEPGTYSIGVRVTDDGSPAASTLMLVEVQVQSFIADALVANPTWPESFLAELSAAGFGAGGYSATEVATSTLPWTGLDQVQIRFNKDVAVNEGDLNLFGAIVGQVEPLPGGFSYDASNFTAIWRFADAFVTDRFLLVLAGTAIGLDPGSNFEYRFNVVLGDVDGNGGVNFGDYLRTRALVGKTAGMPGYDVRFDLDGDGEITNADPDLARARVGSVLPTEEPAMPAPESVNFAHVVANDSGIDEDRPSGEDVVVNPVVAPVEDSPESVAPVGAEPNDPMENQRGSATSQLPWTELDESNGKIDGATDVTAIVAPGNGNNFGESSKPAVVAADRLRSRASLGGAVVMTEAGPSKSSSTRDEREIASPTLYEPGAGASVTMPSKSAVAPDELFLSLSATLGSAVPEDGRIESGPIRDKDEPKTPESALLRARNAVLAALAGSARRIEIRSSALRIGPVTQQTVQPLAPQRINDGRSIAGTESPRSHKAIAWTSLVDSVHSRTLGNWFENDTDIIESGVGIRLLGR